MDLILQLIMENPVMGGMFEQKAAPNGNFCAWFPFQVSQMRVRLVLGLECLN